MRKVAVLIFAVCLGALSGCAAHRSPHEPAFSLAEIQANPAVINGEIVNYIALDGLRLENMTLRHTAFLQCTGKDVRFKNVVFDNCRFINVRLTGAVLENVTFRGGLLTGQDDPGDLSRRTRFDNSVFTRVVFDGTSFENAHLGINNSTVTLRNVTSAVGKTPLFFGDSIHLTLEQCIFLPHLPVIGSMQGDSTLAARFSKFDRVNFGLSTFTSASLQDCEVLGGPLYQQAQPSPVLKGARGAGENGSGSLLQAR